MSGYDLYRNGTSIGTTSATSRTFSSLTCGTSYTLGVDAFDAAGNKSAASTISASTAACPDTQAPTAPTGLTVTGSTTTSLSISWSASFDNVSVTGYDVYNGSTVAGTTSTFTSYTVSGLTCGTSYTLAVDAFDAAGNKSSKTSVTTSTAACADTQAPTTPTGLIVTGSTTTSVSISWSASFDNVSVAGYDVYKGSTVAGTTSTFTSYTVSGLTCGTSYTLAVDAFDAAGNKSAKTSLTTSTAACADTQAPTTPTGLIVTGSTTTTVSLTWTASTDNVGATGYKAFVNGSQVGTSTSTSYQFTGLTCGTTYSLGVAANDAAGNTSPTATISSATGACAPSSPSAAASVFLSPSGNDSSCSRNGSACRSFDRADSIAQNGDVIQVAPGVYPSGPPNYGYGQSIMHSTQVTFVCQPSASADSVSFTDPEFLIGPGGGNIAFNGSCFHFHILDIGLRGYSGGSNIIHDVTLNGVHMDSFDITGVNSVTVNNSQIGPIVACFGSVTEAQTNGAPASAACSSSGSPVEAYWASVGGTAGKQDEPFVHDNGSDTATNVTFNGDHFTGMQTKWPDYFHQGGLLVWGSSGLNDHELDLRPQRHLRHRRERRLRRHRLGAPG